MKKLFLIILNLSIMTCGLIASSYQISLGPTILLKGGVNAASVATGTQNAFGFIGMPDFGLNINFPFEKKSPTSGYLELTYLNNGFSFKQYGTSNYSDYLFNYFAIGAGLNIYGFTIGVNYGIPLDYKVEKKSFDTDILSGTFDITIGAMIPLVKSNTGTLNFVIRGSYSANGSYNEDKIFPKPNPFYNVHPATIGAGLNYSFNIKFD